MVAFPRKPLKTTIHDRRAEPFKLGRHPKSKIQNPKS
jgi:hypothetical protein